MAEVHVIFQKAAKPIVYNASTPALKGEYIFWHIHNEDLKVKKVKIVFGKKGRRAKFFPTRLGKRSAITNDLSKRNFIWGISPHPIGNGQKKDKYSIIGLDASGKQVDEAYLDPTILSDDP